jgi:uncharacterized protein (TIGR02599 family)
MAAFTLIELMAATTVLSVVLLMMVGMQDQMSKAWSNANRRTDATREARAACLLMARDLSTFSVRINRYKYKSSLSYFIFLCCAQILGPYFHINGHRGFTNFAQPS